MKAQNTSRNIPDRMESAFARRSIGNVGSESASVHMLDSSTRPGRHRSLSRARDAVHVEESMVNFLVMSKAYLCCSSSRQGAPDRNAIRFLSRRVLDIIPCFQARLRDG